MLEKWREEIDAIDKDMIKLLERRFAMVEAIGAYKIKDFRAIRDLKRESEQLNCWNQQIKTSKYQRYILSVLSSVLETSREMQSHQQGVKGESHEVSLL